MPSTPQSPKSARGGARPGAGRKPMPAAQRRARAITVAFTDDQYAELDRAADDAGITVAELVFQRTLTVQS